MSLKIEKKDTTQGAEFKVGHQARLFIGIESENDDFDSDEFKKEFK